MNSAYVVLGNTAVLFCCCSVFGARGVVSWSELVVVFLL